MVLRISNSLEVPAIKKYRAKGFSKSEKPKKKSESIISLASLEIVEQQLAIVTTLCSTSAGDSFKKEGTAGTRSASQEVLISDNKGVDNSECVLTGNNSNNLVTDENTEKDPTTPH